MSRLKHYEPHVCDLVAERSHVGRERIRIKLPSGNHYTNTPPGWEYVGECPVFVPYDELRSANSWVHDRQSRQEFQDGIREMHAHNRPVDRESLRVQCRVPRDMCVAVLDATKELEAMF